MKTKELKNFAQKIAKFETIIQTSTDDNKITEAKNEIMKLSSHVQSLEDIVIIDEYVQEILQKKS